MAPGHGRVARDVSELRGIDGVTVEPVHGTSACFIVACTWRTTSLHNPDHYTFRVSVPSSYPFKPPNWKWIDRPKSKGHPNLGPEGIVSVDVLSTWSPTNSLANVVIELFPSQDILLQVEPVTAGLQHLQVSKPQALIKFTDPQVLDCLISYLFKTDPETVRVLHLTCRNSSVAVKQAIQHLKLTAKAVDLALIAYSFPALTSLRCTQCTIDTQSLIEAQTASPSLFTSLASLTLTRCDVTICGPSGLAALAATLPALRHLSLELNDHLAGLCTWHYRTAALHALNLDEAFAARDALTSGKEDMPSRIWPSLASVTQLTSVAISLHLSDPEPSSSDDVHPWCITACMASAAIPTLASLPSLSALSLRLMHSVASPDAVRGVAPSSSAGTSEGPEVARSWPLPVSAPHLKELTLEGLTLAQGHIFGSQQLTLFWRGLKKLHLRTMRLTDVTLPCAHSALVSLMPDVQDLDLAWLSLLPPAPAIEDPIVSYSSLSKLHTVRTAFLESVRGLPSLRTLHWAPRRSPSSPAHASYHPPLPSPLSLVDLMRNAPNLECLTGVGEIRINCAYPHSPRKGCAFPSLRRVEMAPTEGDSLSVGLLRTLLTESAEIIIPQIRDARSVSTHLPSLLLPAHKPILSPFTPTQIAASGGALVVSSADAAVDPSAFLGFNLAHSTGDSDEGDRSQDFCPESVATVLTSTPTSSPLRRGTSSPQQGERLCRRQVYHGRDLVSREPAREVAACESNVCISRVVPGAPAGTSNPLLAAAGRRAAGWSATGLSSPAFSGSFPQGPAFKRSLHDAAPGPSCEAYSPRGKTLRSGHSDDCTGPSDSTAPSSCADQGRPGPSQPPPMSPRGSAGCAAPHHRRYRVRGRVLCTDSHMPEQHQQDAHGQPHARAGRLPHCSHASTSHPARSQAMPDSNHSNMVASSFVNSDCNGESRNTGLCKATGVSSDSDSDFPYSSSVLHRNRAAPGPPVASHLHRNRSAPATASRLPPQTTSATPASASMRASHQGTCGATPSTSEPAPTKEISIHALPMCLHGHPTDLVLQLNCHASPQFEHLGPYLVRASFCRICHSHVPSVLDLTKHRAPGVCIDSIAVVNAALNARVHARLTPHAAQLPDAAADPTLTEKWLVRQVVRPGSPMLFSPASQIDHLMWMSAWAPCNPRCEQAPTADALAALAALRLNPAALPPRPPPPPARAKLGGCTSSSSSPTCRLCCNRMHLTVTMPVHGPSVVLGGAKMTALTLYKCHLHPSEAKCCWGAAVHVEPSRTHYDPYAPPPPANLRFQPLVPPPNFPHGENQPGPPAGNAGPIGDGAGQPAAAAAAGHAPHNILAALARAAIDHGHGQANIFW